MKITDLPMPLNEAFTKTLMLKSPRVKRLTFYHDLFYAEINGQGDWICDFNLTFKVANVPSDILDLWGKARDEHPERWGTNCFLPFGEYRSLKINGTWYCDYGQSLEDEDVCKCDVWVNGCTCGVFQREQRAKGR
jgi:hypothetical protein